MGCASDDGFGCVLQTRCRHHSVVCRRADGFLVSKYFADLHRHQVPVYEEVSVILTSSRLKNFTSFHILQETKNSPLKVFIESLFWFYNTHANTNNITSKMNYRNL